MARRVRLPLKPPSGSAGGTIPPTQACGVQGGQGETEPGAGEHKGRLSDLADDVLEGRTDKGVAAVASQVLNVYLRAVLVELKVREVEDLEERISALEADKTQRRRGGEPETTVGKLRGHPAAGCVRSGGGGARESPVSSGPSIEPLSLWEAARTGHERTLERPVQRR
jgi:hypothetical protein